MGLLQAMTGQPGFLKAGFFGFTKSGKTWTAMLLAIGTRKLFEHDGPIAMFDTEGGSDYIGRIIKRETGKDLLVFKGRSFDQLKAVAKECLDSGVSVLMVDSITHVWRELMEAYCEKRKIQSSLMPISAIMEIKNLWAPWPDFYLTSPLHIIICGRGGYEWEMREDEESGRKVLTKTGTKMKVETEFGFEASLLVEMERINEQGTGISRQATIIGDRFGVIDGKSQENPTFEFFLPHLELLKPNGHMPVDVTSRSNPDVDESGSGWAREKKQRVIFAEEIQAELVRKFPSTSVMEKASKAAILWGIFGTRSWTAVEGLRSEILKSGLEVLRDFLADEASLEDYFAQPDHDPSCLTTLHRSRQSEPQADKDNGDPGAALFPGSGEPGPKMSRKKAKPEGMPEERLKKMILPVIGLGLNDKEARSAVVEWMGADGHTTVELVDDAVYNQLREAADKLTADTWRTWIPS